MLLYTTLIVSTYAIGRLVGLAGEAQEDDSIGRAIWYGVCVAAVAVLTGMFISDAGEMARSLDQLGTGL